MPIVISRRAAPQHSGGNRSQGVLRWRTTGASCRFAPVRNPLGAMDHHGLCHWHGLCRL